MTKEFKALRSIRNMITGEIPQCINLTTFDTILMAHDVKLDDPKQVVTSEGLHMVNGKVQK
jgi:hypothetical protein